MITIDNKNNGKLLNFKIGLVDRNLLNDQACYIYNNQKISDM